MLNLRTLKDINTHQKRVLVRLDLNLPLDEKGKVTDTNRLERSLPTLQQLLEQKAKIILISHLGRPKGKPCPDMSLKKIITTVENTLKKKIAFIDDPFHPQSLKTINQMNDETIALVENLRFYPQEEKNDPVFAEKLAQLADIYVNDAFSCAHRPHSSIQAVTQFLPSYAGHLMNEELSTLDQALHCPQKPLAGIIGGSKISSKIQLLNHLLPQLDMLVIGGAMANTFLAAQGHHVGKSLYEKDCQNLAVQIIQNAQKHQCQLILPDDVVVTQKLCVHQPYHAVACDQVQPDDMIVDIGPQSIEKISQKLEKYHTLIWNGPLGAFEYPPFDQGTNGLAQKVALLTREKKLTSIAGGGDTVSALKGAGVDNDFSYLSTAGGAFLEWLEGKTLPGVVPLIQ